MKQLIICILILLIAVSCELNSSIHSADEGNPAELAKPQKETSGDSITVFFTGNMLGSLKPCGCSGGQLGGLDRRPAIFNTVPAENRLIIDTGSLVKEQSIQNLIKYTIIIQALKYIDYDVVNLTKLDIEMGKQSGLLDSSSEEFISSYETDEKFPMGTQHEFELKGQNINIAIVSFDPLEMPLESIKKLFPDEPDSKKVNILILNNYSDEIISQISQLGVVDCLVCPIKSDEPTVVSAAGTKPLVFATGQFGRYISKLKIQFDKSDNLKLSFEDIPVKEGIAQDEYLVGLYKEYQLRVKDANLLENNPRYGLPGSAKYAGSQSCESNDCHSEPLKHQFEYVVWMKSNHANAYATLEKVGSQYDPECIVCHVVGYDFESGYVSESKTPHLKNVGCEYCHGPGSEHNTNPYQNKLTVRKTVQEVIKDVCLKCHTPEHSGDFAGHEREKLELIKHWTELKDANNVK